MKKCKFCFLSACMIIMSCSMTTGCDENKNSSNSETTISQPSNSIETSISETELDLALKESNFERYVSEMFLNIFGELSEMVFNKYDNYASIGGVICEKIEDVWCVYNEGEWEFIGEFIPFIPQISSINKNDVELYEGKYQIIESRKLSVAKKIFGNEMISSFSIYLVEDFYFTILNNKINTLVIELVSEYYANLEINLNYRYDNVEKVIKPGLSL